MESHRLIHQFGFRSKHAKKRATKEQMHRIVKRMNNDMEAVRCTAVSQAFYKIWYQGLLYKFKNNFPTDIYGIIRFYLFHRTFRVKYGEVII